MIDMTGKKYNRLTVTSLAGKRGKKQEYHWNAICDCGKEVIVNGATLRRGTTKSCGCLNMELRTERIRTMGKIHGGWNKDTNPDVKYIRMEREYIRGAKNRGYTYTLSLDDLKHIVDQNCHYCGKTESNGIDRIDNNRGYEIDNVLPCCRTCNFMKGPMSYEDFVIQIGNIARNMGLDK